MMVKDDAGQIALEYLLIVSVSLILLIVFTLPLSETVVKDTLDVSDSLDAKSDLLKIAQAIREVYGQGQGSKQTVKFDSSRSLKVNVAQNYISSKVPLKDGTNKVIRIDCISNLGKTSFNIAKGDNTVIVEWPQASKTMRIYGL